MFQTVFYVFCSKLCDRIQTIYSQSRFIVNPCIRRVKIYSQPLTILGCCNFSTFRTSYNSSSYWLCLQVVHSAEQEEPLQALIGCHCCGIINRFGSRSKANQPSWRPYSNTCASQKPDWIGTNQTLNELF